LKYRDFILIVIQLTS